MAEGAESFNCFWGFSYHFFCFFAYCEDFFCFNMAGNAGGFADRDTFAFYVDEDVGGTKVYCEVVGEEAEYVVKHR